MPNFKFFNPIERELDIVERQLQENINSPLNLLNEASIHLIKAGGKRLRPGFTLMAAKMYSDSLEKTMPMAVALELIHMASLVHDDVIDDSETRRGSETVKKKWGNRMSIYAGNYIVARALALVNEYHRSDLVDILADTSMNICAGEIQQMLNCYNIKLALKDYLRRIERKTALLIAVSCQLGAMINEAPPRETEAFRKYGYYLGMAFQISDDILDFIADTETLGKPTGNDIRQGIITLPALYALKNLPERQELGRMLSSPQLCKSETSTIMHMVIESGGVNYAYQVTRKYVLKAQEQLRSLPDKAIKKALQEIPNFVLARNF